MLEKNYTDVGIEKAAVDEGLRAYLVSVYNHMAGALAIPAAVAFLVANTSLIAMMFDPQTGGMSVLGWLFLLWPLIVIFGFDPRNFSAGTGGFLAVFGFDGRFVGADLSGLYRRQHGSGFPDYGGNVRRDEHLRNRYQTRFDLDGFFPDDGIVGNYHCIGCQPLYAKPGFVLCAVDRVGGCLYRADRL